ILNSRLKPKLLVAAVVVRCYESALNFSFLELFFAFGSTESDLISAVFSLHFFEFSSVKF
ncbi:hypothetical protein LIT13_15110, partial [Flavobacterium psychrophilum]|uniref:hypothetical protein n=1 Tax=Flavobacterium psychrophilum TaxID=96345 RepID=UPI001D077544